MITPSGLCCKSGDVDAAGVCDGKGESVSKEVRLNGVTTAAGSSARRLLADTLEERITIIVTEQLGYPTDVSPLGFTVNITEGADGKPVVRHSVCTDNDDNAKQLSRARLEADIMLMIGNYRSRWNFLSMAHGECASVHRSVECTAVHMNSYGKVVIRAA